MEIKLIPCHINTFNGEAHDFFKNIEGDTYIIAYKYKLKDGTYLRLTYGILKKHDYKDGGEYALTVDNNLIYILGANCYIIGYRPIDIIIDEN